jgi:uncharacterized protein YbjT (DUF2867 family)
MKVIITGSTGMVGKATLIECLETDLVKEVLVINRSPINIQHSKLKEIIHPDFSEFSSIATELEGYDACFHCMGVSALGLNEVIYTQVTYGVTKALADVLYTCNPAMVFNYVSGAGTDSSEQGRLMWARVKGATENYILNLGFKDAYAFRPGGILPEKGVKSKTGWYNAFYVICKPLFPLLKKLNSVTLSSKLGKVMILVVMESQKIKHLENSDINKLSEN